MLAAHVVHEMPYPERLFATCKRILKTGGRLLLIEPTGHVSVEDFAATAVLARKAGFADRELTPVGKSHQILMANPGDGPGGQEPRESQ